MSIGFGTSRGYASHPRLRRRRRFIGLTAPAILLGIGAIGGLSIWQAAPELQAELALETEAAPQQAEGVTASADRAPAPSVREPMYAYEPLLDPSYSLGSAPLPLGRNQPLDAGFQWSAPAVIAAVHPHPQVEPAPALAAPLQHVAALPLPPLVEAPRVVEAVPVPPSRPAELRAPPAAPEVKAPVIPERPRIAAPVTPKATRMAAAPAAQKDDRSFFQKFFGVQPSPQGQAMAYAAPQDDMIDGSRNRRLGTVASPAPATTAGTAVYDIAARMVYMPNGERLEAHSGLGPRLDDPRYVHERMRGATPPHTYDLTEREALFHGVRAIRLNPVGGSGAIHGRDGLLAHTYMLGPNGDSNGCVSIRDYDRFLQAFLRGEVKRLVVVASR